MFHSGNNVLVSIMITRMLLSLRRASAEDLSRSWGVDENGSSLAFPTSPRMLRGAKHFSSSAGRVQITSVIPIPLETIDTRDEQCHI